jgi:hypothetical protein
MDKRTRFRSVFVVIAILVVFSAVVVAAERHFSATNAATKSEAVSRSRNLLVEPYGVGVTPAVYLVNFLLLYIANPGEAANMPAYRAAIPQDLYDCLQLNHEGCNYDEFESSLNNHDVEKGTSILPRECRAEPKWEVLAPSIAKHPDQINEPLGIKRADAIARRLGIDKSMILTDMEYQCTIGTPAIRALDPDRETIFQCITNLTNSNGNTDIPLSSYGLAISDTISPNGAQNVQSLCAPQAPCLVFNDLFAGPLERIAAVCGWGSKLESMVRTTPFFRFAARGHECQLLGGAGTDGACVVETIPGRVVEK